ADDEDAGEIAERALLLLPDHALDRRSTTAAIFLRPVQAGPAGVGLLLLPGLCDVEDVGALELDAAERGLAQFVLILLRRIRRDPGFRLGAERGFLRGVVEVHRFFLSVIPGRATREPGISIHNLWISGSAPSAHPGMTIRATTPRSSCACGRSARLPSTRGCRDQARPRWHGGSTCGSRTPR